MTTPGMPDTVHVAQRLLYVAVGLMAAYLVVGLFARDEVADMLVDRDPSLSARDAAAAANVGLSIIAFGYVVAAAALLLSARRFRRRSNTGRWIVTLLSLLWLGYGVLILLGTPTPDLSVILVLVNLALAFSIVVLLWRHESRDWFTPPPVTNA